MLQQFSGKAELDFGECAEGASCARRLRIVNPSEHALVVGAERVPAGFSVMAAAAAAAAAAAHTDMHYPIAGAAAAAAAEAAAGADPAAASAAAELVVPARAAVDAVVIWAPAGPGPVRGTLQFKSGRHRFTVTLMGLSTVRVVDVCQPVRPWRPRGGSNAPHVAQAAKAEKENAGSIAGVRASAAARCLADAYLHVFVRARSRSLKGAR